MKGDESAPQPAISPQLRIKFFLTGIVFPGFCFFATHLGSTTIDSPWQSGRLQDYVSLLLDWPGHAPMLPLVVISAAGLGTWVIRPACSRSLLTQMGIWTGVLLSSQFFIYVLLTTGVFTLVVAAIAAPILAGVVAGGYWLATHTKRFSIRHLLGVTAVAAILITLVQWLGGWETVWASTGGIYFLIVCAGPTLCLVTYLRAGYWMCRHAASKPFRHYATAWAGWLIVWGINWKLSVDIMMREYAKLPTTDPNCYVSTAAQSGHRALVGDVAPGALSNQTRRLKFLELSLAVAFPGCHHKLRWLYDRAGPPLAALCRSHVWIADASFLLLKPLEWSARLLALITRFRLEY